MSLCALFCLLQCCFSQSDGLHLWTAVSPIHLDTCDVPPRNPGSAAFSHLSDGLPQQGNAKTANIKMVMSMFLPQRWFRVARFCAACIRREPEGNMGITRTAFLSVCPDMTSNIHRVAVRKLNHWNSLCDFDELIFDKCDSTVQDVHESLHDLQGMAFAANSEVNVSDVRKIGCVQECMFVRDVACCMRCFNARFRSAECEAVCDIAL
jgi:hypothetical protein